MASDKNMKQERVALIAVAIVVLIIVAVLVLQRIIPDDEDPSPSTGLSSSVETPPLDVSWPTVEDDSPDGDPPETSGPTEDDPSVPTEPSEPDVTQPADPSPTTPTIPTTPVTPEDPEEDAKLSCDRIASFSGRFVEDGTDAPVENVAALLVTNVSEKYLDLANIVYEIDGQKATFIVTGLPAGSSAWVMEYSGLTIGADSTVEYVGTQSSFRDGVASSAEELTITSDGNILYAKNNTDRTLENVFIYYKYIHSDGNFFGGITYMVQFGSIEPGETAEKLGGHFSAEESMIVRVGWQESQADESS